MDLLNIWYTLSSFLGVILTIGGILFAVAGAMFLWGICIALWERSFDEIPFILGVILVCAIVSSIVYFVNVNVVRDQIVISDEIPNIISYEGIANVHEGKFNYDYLYFTQGINNNYSVLKLNPDECKLHYVNDSDIKIVKNHTEYLSKLRFLGVLSMDDKTNYDVYLPDKYRK